MLQEEYLDLALKKAYGKWLKELEQTAPYMLHDPWYSNPYFTCVPKHWCSSPVRIQIVGEEGFGKWARGRDTVLPSEIGKIQTFCWSSLASYLDYGKEYSLYPEAETFKRMRSPFWLRARRLSAYGICSWSNQDLIHRRTDRKCALSESDRLNLHSVDTKILGKEIEILKPTHVVLFGWYGLTIQQEIPALFRELYPNGLGENHVWYKNVVHREIEGIHYIAAYHPNWGIRQKGYEAKLMQVLESTL